MLQSRWGWPRLDPRSLIAFRVVLGVVLLLDLVVFRAANLNSFYTDQSIIPAELAQRLGVAPSYTALTPWTPMLWLHSPLAAGAFFALLPVVHPRLGPHLKPMTGC